MNETAQRNALTRLRQVTRALDGAKYDLTREDRHPNDLHKALAKIEEARTSVSVIERMLR